MMPDADYRLYVWDRDTGDWWFIAQSRSIFALRGAVRQSLEQNRFPPDLFVVRGPVSPRQRPRDPKLARLGELARAIVSAAPGPWSYDVASGDVDSAQGPIAGVEMPSRPHGDALGLYLAAFDPQTVLNLLNTIRHLRARPRSRRQPAQEISR